jgi:hypothetical protein
MIRESFQTQFFFTGFEIVPPQFPPVAAPKLEANLVVPYSRLDIAAKVPSVVLADITGQKLP